MKCPQCQAEAKQFEKFWMCSTHGQLPEPRPFAPLRIFLSYGHDANEDLVRRIKADLENRGHDVWFDKSEIKFGDDWRREITEGIVGSHRVLSFLSKYSTRDPGVCLDEIAIAIGSKGGNIQTILVESEQEVKAPPSVSHLQWLDMHDWKERREANGETWEQWYQSKLAEIIDVVESEESRRFAGEIHTLSEYLKPTTSDFASDARVRSLLEKQLVGRKWVFKAVEEWRTTEDRGSRLFWIMGDPGVGKSAIAANLAHFYGKGTVIGVHFCDWQKPDHRDAARIVRTLAFQIATRLPDYRKLLLTLPEIQKLEDKSPSELFGYLLANPLKIAINGGRERLLVVIDALDEAGDAGRNPLVEMLARDAQLLPDWLGIVVTSRPEFDVKTPLQALNPFPLDTRSELNRDDIREYLRQQLATGILNSPDPEAIVERILEKSEGVILYAERFCEEVLHGYLDLNSPDEFPQGLGGIFFQYFRRQFPDLDGFRKNVRPALRAILAAREPLPVELLQRLCDWHDEELSDFTRPLASLFPVTTEAGQEVIKPYHKSLADWLADEAKAGTYFVSPSEGNRMLAHQGIREFRDNVRGMPAYWVAHLAKHFVESQMPQELAELLSSFEFLMCFSAYVGLSYNAGSEFASRILAYLDFVAEQSSEASQKLAELRANLTDFAAGLDLWMVRGVGGADSAATCKKCSCAGIIHGHVDLGGVDYYDNYYAFCPNCFWAFHTEHYSMFGSEEAVWEFDYSTDTYHWPWH